MTVRGRVVAALAAMLLVAAVAPLHAAADDAAALARLQDRRLAVPVDGVPRAAVRDTFTEGRVGHRHEAIDIAAPRGTRVFAVAPGTVVKLFHSIPGGLTVYQFDASGEFAYYYAHLDRYAETLREGQVLPRCALLGYVGSTGNASANAPHLHFAVFRLGPERRWWKGDAIDPFDALRTDSGQPPCP